jgi:regulator of sigma E protease
MANLIPWILAVLAFALLVLVHEMGHLLMAKALGVAVDSFSIGFGPRLFGIQHGGTDYRISLVPLGGYVKLKGELNLEKGVAPAGDELMSRPWWQRALVISAGPAMNIIFPVVLLFALYVSLGKPALDGPALITKVVEGRPAASAGLLADDVIVAVNDQAVLGHSQLPTQLNAAAKARPDQPLSLTVQRHGQALKLTVTPKLDGGVYRIGVQIEPGPTMMGRRVDKVVPGLPAEKAGFKKGDEIISVDGKPLVDGRSFNKAFAGSLADPVPVAVSRSGQVTMLLAIKRQPVPQGSMKPEEMGLLGLELENSATLAFMKLSVVQAGTLAVLEPLDLAFTMLRGIWDLATLKVRFRESVGGPITIMRMAHQQAESGLLQLLDFATKISIMLCVMNLLPIPLLDGGTLALCLLEGVRRKPLGEKAQSALQWLGLSLLILIFAGAFFNDLSSLAGKWFHPKP